MKSSSSSHVSHKPVFIVGMNGSGTTMMLDHLGRHPELFGFKVETYILPHYLLAQQRYRDMANDVEFLRLWNDMRKEYAFRRRNKGQPVALPADWAQVPRNPAAVFDRILLEFAQREGKSRWCEKTPMYVLHIQRIAQFLSGALFIHMLRDGRDCAASNHRRWGRHPDGTITSWKHIVSEGRRQGSLIGDRYCEVRYEDVTESPETEMQRVCSFLGVNFDDRILESDKTPRNLGRESRTIVSNRNRGENYFTDRRLRRLEEFAGLQLASLGYPTQIPDGNRNPGRLLRSLWFAHDAFAVFARQLRNKLKVQKKMTWSLYLARLRSTIRKTRSSSSGSVQSPGRDDG